LVSVLPLMIGSAAVAQDKYPSKPVKIVVPYAPGGATDITSRLFGEHMKNILGQPFVVENKPGAFGILGIEEMARSKPDGYTLFVGNVSTNAITPVLFQKKFNINFEKDVVSVTRLAIYPSFVITTTANFDVKNVKELQDLAKKNPGKVRYTSAGVGSFPHFDMEVFARRMGVDMVHIPNKTGAAGMINDLVVGDAQVAMLNAASSAAMIKAGKLRPIAVTGKKRLASAPDVPTFDEAGLPGIEASGFQGIFVPAGTPPAIVSKLSDAILRVLAQPDVRERFASQGLDTSPLDVKDFAAFIKSEAPKWAGIAKAANIKAEQ
jgi:tripartite-type tricarboxylate transporter receptor subunit TctC